MPHATSELAQTQRICSVEDIEAGIAAGRYNDDIRTFGDDCLAAYGLLAHPKGPAAFDFVWARCQGSAGLHFRMLNALDLLDEVAALLIP